MSTSPKGRDRVPAGVPTGGQFAASPRAEAEVALYFHVAPEPAWDSIAEHGIDHARGESAYAETSLDYPAGNYLFADVESAAEYADIREREERDTYGPDEAYADAVFEVRHDGPVELDPFRDDPSGLGTNAVFTTAAIPATQVRRLD